MHSFVIFSAMWKVQHEFSIFWKLQCRFITKNDLKFSTKLEVKSFMFHNVQGEYRAVIALRWFSTESCIQLICIPWDERWQKSHSLSCQKCQKSRMICYPKNVENPATFVEGFWPEFQARGRFMKYSMSDFQTPSAI